MAEVALNCSIERCFQGPPIVCGDAVVIEKGQVEVIGAGTAGTSNLVVVAAAAADGATQRAADIAAGRAPRPDRYTPIYEAEDITVMKKSGVNAIIAGTKLWWCPALNVAISALTQQGSAGTGYAVFTALEISNDTDNTIRVAFDGRKALAEVTS